jgi:hypothetical protein
MVKIDPPQGDRPEEGFDAAGPAAPECFAAAGQGGIGQQVAVVVERFRNVGAVEQQSGAQPGFDPIGQRSIFAAGAQACPGPGEEGLRLEAPFGLRRLVEFFLPTARSAGSLERILPVRVRAMIKFSRLAINSTKRWWLARSSLRAGASAAGIWRVTLRPSSQVWSL